MFWIQFQNDLHDYISLNTTLLNLFLLPYKMTSTSNEIVFCTYSREALKKELGMKKYLSSVCECEIKVGQHPGLLGNIKCGQNCNCITTRDELGMFTTFPPDF